MDVSLIIPVYNEDESLPELYTWIDKVLEDSKLSAEVIMIDDGSTDDSWKAIEQLSRNDDRVLGLKFNRNYGKSADDTSGISRAFYFISN